MKNAFFECSKKIRALEPWTQALSVSWVVSTTLIFIGILSDSIPVKVVGALLSGGYILILIVRLARSRPRSADLPEFAPLIHSIKSYRTMLFSVIIFTSLLITLSCIILNDGWLMLYPSILLSLIVMFALRKNLKKKHLIMSLFVVAALGFAEQTLGPDNSSGLVVPILGGIMFLAGAVLLDRTRLSFVVFQKGGMLQAAKSFASGCLLAVPPALLNLLTIQLFPASDFDRLFTNWLNPLYAFQPGILEEIWARLLLTTFFYALLRPLCKMNPSRALVWAMVISSVIHGLAHYPGSITTPWEGVFIALVYGIPLVLLYVKRDLTYAIGYHFFIDFVRFSYWVIMNNL